MFVATEPVAVSDEAGNTIYIRPKMGKGVEAQVSSEFGRLGGRTQTAYEFSLLAFNIVRWEGPAFTDSKGKLMPVNRANIERLDPAELLVNQVINRIIELNTRRITDPDPPEPYANGESEADPTPAAEPI